MDTQTWATIATMLATGIALAGLMITRFDKLESRLESRIEQVRQEAKADNEATRNDIGKRIDRLEADIRAELTDIRASLRALEQRFFELLLPRRPAPTGTDDS